MTKYYLTFTLIVVNLSVFATNVNETLNEYLYNKINICKLKTSAENNTVDSALVYANKIFESSDKTFYIEANVLLSDMYFNLQYQANKPLDVSHDAIKERYLFINKNKVMCFYYLDRAVEYGLCWNCIDENKKEYYDLTRYQINRDFYLANYANVELIDLIKEIEVTDQGNRRAL